MVVPTEHSSDKPNREDQTPTQPVRDEDLAISKEGLRDPGAEIIAELQEEDQQKAAEKKEAGARIALLRNGATTEEVYGIQDKPQPKQEEDITNQLDNLIVRDKPSEETQKALAEVNKLQEARVAKEEAKRSAEKATLALESTTTLPEAIVPEEQYPQLPPEQPQANTASNNDTQTASEETEEKKKGGWGKTITASIVAAAIALTAVFKNKDNIPVETPSQEPKNEQEAKTPTSDTEEKTEISGTLDGVKARREANRTAETSIVDVNDTTTLQQAHIEEDSTGQRFNFNTGTGSIANVDPSGNIQHEASASTTPEQAADIAASVIPDKPAPEPEKTKTSARLGNNDPIGADDLDSSQNPEPPKDTQQIKANQPQPVPSEAGVPSTSSPQAEAPIPDTSKPSAIDQGEEAALAAAAGGDSSWLEREKEPQKTAEKPIEPTPDPITNTAPLDMGNPQRTAHLKAAIKDILTELEEKAKEKLSKTSFEAQEFGILIKAAKDTLNESIRSESQAEALKNAVDRIGDEFVDQANKEGFNARNVSGPIIEEIYSAPAHVVRHAAPVHVTPPATEVQRGLEIEAGQER